MKKAYITPEIEVAFLDCGDVILTSKPENPIAVEYDEGGNPVNPV